MSFRLVSAQFEGREIPLWLTPKDQSPTDLQNACTILIGKNGAGKSRFLADICRAFVTLEDHARIPQRRKRLGRSSGFHAFELEYAVDGVVTQVATNGPDVTAFPRNILPSRVIATTISPSDKFPVPDSRRRDRSAAQLDLRFGKRDASDGGDARYRYLGLKNEVGNMSNLGHLSRITDSLIFASGKDLAGRFRLSQVFEFLGYFPFFEVHFELRVALRRLQNFVAADPNEVEELEGALIGLSPPHNALSYKLRDLIEFPERVREIQIAVSDILPSVQGARSITVGLDVHSAVFEQGSLEIFQHLRMLRQLGIVALLDFRLFRADLPSGSLSITEASSGEQAVVLTILGIAGEIEDNSLVIIDEPEISLHPEWQERFVPLLASTFSKYHGCHFLLATHSPQILAHGAEANAVVVAMDDLSIVDAEELAKKSADFQLATMFDTPGYRNEYLARIGLAALHLVNKKNYESAEFEEKMLLLRDARPHLHDDDPVAQLVDALITAVDPNDK